LSLLHAIVISQYSRQSYKKRKSSGSWRIRHFKDLFCVSINILMYDSASATAKAGTGPSLCGIVRFGRTRFEDCQLYPDVTFLHLRKAASRTADCTPMSQTCGKSRFEDCRLYPDVTNIGEPALRIVDCTPMSQTAEKTRFEDRRLYSNATNI
jgi:hypothetical protein